MASERPADAIAIRISPLQPGEDGTGWVGAPLRLTGEAALPAATHRVTIGTEATGPAELLWTGARLSIHRDALGSARGMVLGFMDIAPEVEDEFTDWYETEHMPRLAALPGVLLAARYRASAASILRFLALYQMEDVRISQSEDWMAAARTPWSARMRRFSINYTRYSLWRAPKVP